jgi:hypothetical protein
MPRRPLRLQDKQSAQLADAQQVPSTQLPLAHCAPVTQTVPMDCFWQIPETQDSPPPQTSPHVPQLRLSLSRLVHVSLQGVIPAGHADPEVWPANVVVAEAPEPSSPVTVRSFEAVLPLTPPTNVTASWQLAPGRRFVFTTHPVL